MHLASDLYAVYQLSKLDYNCNQKSTLNLNLVESWLNSFTKELTPRVLCSTLLWLSNFLCGDVSCDTVITSLRTWRAYEQRACLRHIAKSVFSDKRFWLESKISFTISYMKNLIFYWSWKITEVWETILFGFQYMIWRDL